MTRILCLALCLSGAMTAGAQTPEWIWHPDSGRAATNGEVRRFQKIFQVDNRVSRAVLSVAVDDHANVTLNNSPALSAHGFERSTCTDVTEYIRRGENRLTIWATNGSSLAGVLARLELSLPNRQKQVIVTDTSWSASAPLPLNWVAAASLGKLGVEPWGDPLKTVQATAAESLSVPPGFNVELIRTSEPGEGSWISMTVDNRGRLIISPQDDKQPLLRITLTKAGSVAKIEPIPAKVRQAMGMCYAHDSLYVNGHGPDGTGLYRLIDANRNDRFDTNEVHLLKKFKGEGEHGYHAVVEGPDGMIYVMNGNHTKVPEGVSTHSPHKNYQEDFLLPRLWDANGHAVGILSPGGYIVRTDPEGKQWELMLAGFRNSYDFDFNPDGEIFTFDSDMEWDWGLPWYRPTRIIHAVNGGEYGWRSGSGKWPDYYADSLPAAVNIGIGSPTGVKFGTKSKFPGRYRRALYAMDWSYGRILAVHLQPDGASYTGDFEAFVKGKPLNVSDLEFGRDGAMYFITGGRGTQSGLYRVSYAGQASRLSPARQDRAQEKSADKARALRHKLEAFHGRVDPRAVDFAWPHLGSDDRFIRYAARIAIEWQPVEQWKSRALSETNSQAGLTALLALARCGGTDSQGELLKALTKFPLAGLSEDLQLEKLRVIQLSFIRQGRPSKAQARVALEKLSPLYPSTSRKLNFELVQLLVYLNAPDVIAKTLELIARAQTQEEQIHYIYHLRNAKTGWTLPQREQYFRWFATAKQGARGEITYPQGGTYHVWTNQALALRTHPLELLRWFKEVDRDYGDGSSYSKFLINIRKDANATLTSAERSALTPLLEVNIDAPPWKPTKERQFVKEWTVAELEPRLGEVAAARDFESGKAAFNDAQCVQCHRFDNRGGSVGPELTGVGSKYSRRDILESLLDPSKVVSDQFQNFNIVRKDGDVVSGRITDENKERLILLPNMLAPEATVEIPLAEIASRQPSKVSAMPTGLLNQLTAEEILDLLAYIEAAGKSGAANFQKAAGN